MKYVRTATTVLAGVVIAGMTACSSSTSGSPPSTPRALPPLNLPTAAPAPVARTSTTPAQVALPDPCTLLTRTEAGALAGVRMSPLDPEDDVKARDPQSDIASCTYYAPFTGSPGEVGIFEEESVPHALEVDKAIGHRFHTVAGIGDQTLEEQDNIFVRKGLIWVTLNSAYGAPASRLEAAARTAASRLPST